MLEHFLYSLALLSAAAIFQSIVHYSLKRRKRLQELQAHNLQQHQQQEQERQQHRKNSSNSSLPDMDISCTTESLDGDEPPVFFELLSQTGSQMMSVRDVVYIYILFSRLFPFFVGPHHTSSSSSTTYYLSDFVWI